MAGSSPRMWGIPPAPLKSALQGRFIPTHVGNTTDHQAGGAHAAVHPHACGEYFDQREGRTTLAGSSPRMWGIQKREALALMASRFIPTHVGNTSGGLCTGAPAPVHPHACGEYWFTDGGHGSLYGSSPRMWGIQFSTRAISVSVRFIPTHVGNTAGCTVPNPWPAVHPHACGEYSNGAAFFAGSFGSSPRMWGIHFTSGKHGRNERFIPTHVGNTLQEDARNNSLLAELQRATEPCVLQACSDDDKKGKELCKAAPSPRKKLPGRAVTLS